MGSSSSRHRPQLAADQQQHIYAYPPNTIYPNQGQPVQQFMPQAFPGYTNGQFYGGYAPSPYPPEPYGMMAPRPMGPGHMPYPANPFAMAFGPNMPNPWSGHRPHVPPPTREYHQTATIRNQVNLRKHTLQLEPLKFNSKAFSLKFSFDATTPCRVTTFIGATEDPKQNCRLFCDPEAAARPALSYPKGMEMAFPPSEDFAAQHSVVISAEALPRLTSVSGETYPIIIRLETTTEEGAKEGHSIDELPLGSSLPVWAQAQTTYAKLRQAEEGHWTIRVLKQKIWVNGTSYELQEIYGMESNRTTTAVAPQEDVDGRECVICMTNQRDTMALPCRHMCMCYECAQALKTQTNKCPICRMEIAELMHIKIRAADAAAAPQHQQQGQQQQGLARPAAA